MKPRPIEECYWVVQDRLLAGEYPRDIDDETSRDKVDALLQAGVTCFIDLTTELDGLEPYDQLTAAKPTDPPRLLRFPIPDVSVPEDRGQMVAILDAIDEELNRGGVVYVHCWGGIGRTGTVVGCWLSRHGHRGQAALEKLADLWRFCPKSRYYHSPESPEQAKYVRDWHESGDSG